MGVNLSTGTGQAQGLPTTVKSREKMLPDLPKAKRTIEECKADDLIEMILGEDA